ncbi:MAG: UDP-N-acetylmuramoyl-L-alanine--D-glutamate ligase [Deltaproteobacteria bacterium]|uniref:UDP-N-acetylmuramoyl-L-alanine--D-glutamate ligase n=1 Tax=Desulfobacula sp. TaxID=2593537 RepID=UPI0019A74D8D|nr:UDP-N-acetylmuramoyl-L-alanine--D-glutamate ligase [Candidatus Desulfobacula maris]MBL6995202.1 UDP-N-acetylmuramoyl-L-alanine--D-glutamate ligase [Desulfobacula sp.]
MKKEKQPYFLVIGLGASGISMAKFLRSKGKTIIATDIDASKTKIAQELNGLGIKTEIGFHDQKTFNLASVMVPSPGIPKTNKFIKTAFDLGVGITGELDIFTRYNDLPVIAITGTNGKTTTTTLINDILKSCGYTPFVGGNIGTPLVDHLMNKGKTDVIVAEISSFQLDISRQFRPDVGVLLNISQDHLDRYENYQEYESSKWSIFKHQKPSDKAVINKSINKFDALSKQLKSEIFTFSSDKDFLINCNARIDSKSIKIITRELNYTIKTNQLKELQGTHNKENVAAAVLACLALGADINEIVKGLETFKNLPHRMEFIKTIDGISFYNDSKGTNTDAVIRAINCFEKNIILILGGREKGTDFSLLTNDIQHSVKTIIAMGECRTLIKDTFKNICPVLEVHTMKEAVQTAFNTAFKDDAGEPAIVLLSPACASFDMYKNYAHRGNDFVTLVNALGNK